MTPELQTLQRRKNIRREILREMFDRCQGTERRWTTVDESFAREHAPSYDELRDAAQYLAGEGLIQSHGSGHRYRLTHLGIVEIEQLIDHPDRETKHFSPIAITVTNNNFGSNNVIGSIQSGGTGNVATVSQTVTNSVTNPVMQELRAKAAELPAEQKAEANSVIDELEILLEKGPKALATIKTLITGLVTYWPNAAPWLASQAEQIVHFLGG